MAINVTASPYNADPTGVADATSAIQDAIDDAELSITTVNNYQPQAPSVYIPSGTYKITGTLTISKPIRVFGDGEESSVLNVASTFNAPVIKIALNVLQSAYIVFRLDNFAIKGPNTTFGTQDALDGVAIQPTVNGNDTTVDFDRLRITGMTGNGIQFVDKGNSPRVTNCVIQNNAKAGIRVNGTYCTNVWFENNIIRDNRIGIQFKPTGGSTLTTGRVIKNLIESNNGRTTGTLGSSDMPSVGLWLSNVYDLVISDNYIENHWNDIYVEDTFNLNRVVDNILEFGNSWNLATTYGPPARRAGFFIYSGTSNVIQNNLLLNAPTQPGGCSNANWTPSDGSGYAATYEHVTDNQGINVYRDNYSPNTTDQHVSITNPYNRHTIISTVRDTSDGAGRRVLTDRLWGYRRVFEKFEESGGATDDMYVPRRLTAASGNSALIDAIVHQSNATSNVYTRTTKGGSGGTAYSFEQSNPYGIVWQLLATGSTQISIEIGTAPPASGTYTAGSIRWNSAPAVGQPNFWRCTVGGSPGTWVAGPNL